MSDADRTEWSGVSVTEGRAMVFEVSSQGHRLHYLRSILQGLSDRPIHRSVVLVLGPDFKETIDDLVIRVQRINNLDVLYLSEEEARRCQSKSGLLRRFYSHRTFLRYIRSTGAQVGFTNYLDNITAALALPFGFPQSTVAGILFRPTVHYPDLGVDAKETIDLRTRIKESLTRLVEHVAFRRTLGRSRTLTILSLDPYFASYAERHYSNRGGVRYLPEPFSASTSTVDQHVGSARRERIEFLLFGSITRRKGLLETLDALSTLPEAITSSARLVVAGRMQEQLREKVNDKVRELLAVAPDAEIEIVDRFIPDTELRKLIANCDVVLAPYRRHVGSSGTLAWAAAYRRPVISQRYGLMGALVKRYRLGMTCDPEAPSSIAACIERAVKEGPETLASDSGMASYAAANHPDRFAQIVLDVLESS